MNKQVIVELLEKKLSATGMSAADVAKQLKVSDAQLSQARKLAPTIADAFWQKLAAYLGYKQGWQLADITNFKTVIGTCSYAKENSRACCISYEPGTGKTAALKHFAATTENSFYVECEEYFRNKDFVKAFCKALAIKPEGTRSELIEAIIEKLLRLKKPNVLIDEFDKLNDSDLQLFKTFYNKLEDCCGFVLCGAPFLKKRIESGHNRNRQGFKEIYSRIGGDFIKLNPITEKDIQAICHANGVTDATAVEAIKEASTFKTEKQGKTTSRVSRYYDLRTVKEEVMKYLAIY